MGKDNSENKRILFVISSYQQYLNYIQAKNLEKISDDLFLIVLPKLAETGVDFGVSKEQVFSYDYPARKNTFHRHIFNINTYINRRKHNVFWIRTLWFSPRQTRVYKVLSWPVLSGLVKTWFLFKARDKELAELVKKIDPAIILLPSHAFEGITFELIGLGKRVGIKTLMITENWDTLHNKTIFTIKPDYLGVWSRQQVEHAVEVRGMPEDKIFILGAPKFWDYMKPEAIKTSSPYSFKFALFVGMSDHFDELGALKRLDEIIEKRGLDLKIVYRPNVTQHTRNCPDVFFGYDYKHVVLDESAKLYYKKSKSWDIAHDHFNPIYYPSTGHRIALLANMEFMVCAHSTMILNASLLGKRVYLLSYDDGVHRFGPHWSYQNAGHLFDVERLENVRMIRDINDMEKIFIIGDELNKNSNPLDIDYFIAKDLLDNYASNLKNVVGNILSKHKKTPDNLKKNKIKNIFNPTYFFVLMIFTIFAYTFFVPISVKNYFISQTAMGKLLLPSRLALKKAYNIIHLRYWLTKSDLPIYHIFISPKNQERLIASLPFDPKTLSYGSLLDENKTFVNADFASGEDDYKSSIKIRYRGLSPDHWSKEQKSYRLKFTKDDLFQGQRELNLIIPIDRFYFIEPLNSYRAKKMGLPVAEFKFVRLKINNKDSGVYLASEPWSKELLVKSRLMDTDSIFSTKDLDFDDKDNLFKVNRISDWKNYTNENDNAFEELIALFNLMENAGDEEFARKIGDLFDLESFYRFQLLYVLAGSSHVMDNQNSVLLFKRETGKFYYVPWDVIVDSPHDFYPGLTTLAKRILANEKFMEEFKKVVNEYVADEDNLKDDLAYYDGLYNKYFDEFYKDQTKVDSDYDFDKRIKKYRALIVENFGRASELMKEISSADIAQILPDHDSGRVNFEGSFEFFNDIFLNIDQFLIKNPQFVKRNQNTLALNYGTHIFSDNVIVPKGLRLIIEPGAKLLMAPKVSLISYSPMTALGNANSPITVTALSPASEPWGSFGVVNTGEAKNYFNYFRVSGGSAWGGSSSALVNGIPFISQFSLHNTNSEVYNSSFENGRSDDAFHVVGGSVTLKYNVFKNTSSDALDLDSVKNSIVAGNIFFNSAVKNNGDDGDGLDVSATENLEISDNKIYNFGDKCISVGEGASAVIQNNILFNCNYGLAVKDDSTALIGGNIVIGNRSGGLTIYRKKQEFINGGNVKVTDSIFWNNQREILVDETTNYPTKSGEWKNVEKTGISKLSIKNSIVMGGYDGDNISLERPNFIKILPAFIYNMFNQIK